MKMILEYKCADGPCEVGDVVYLGPNLTEKAELIVVHESQYCDVYIFKPLEGETLFMKDEDGNIAFSGKPYIFAKEVEGKEDQP